MKEHLTEGGFLFFFKKASSKYRPGIIKKCVNVFIMGTAAGFHYDALGGEYGGEGVEEEKKWGSV